MASTAPIGSGLFHVIRRPWDDCPRVTVSVLVIIVSGTGGQFAAEKLPELPDVHAALVRRDVKRFDGRAIAPGALGKVGHECGAVQTYSGVVWQCLEVIKDRLFFG